MRRLAHLLLLVLPFATSLGPLGSIAGLSVVRLVSAGLVAVALVSLPRTLPRAAVWLGLIAAIWLGWGMALVRSPEGVKELLGVALMMFAMIAVMLLVRDRSLLRTFIWGWVLAWFAVAIPAVGEIATGKHLPNYRLDATPDIRNRATDIASYMGQPNLFAWFLVVAVSMMAIGWFLEQGWKRWLLTALLLASPVLAWPSNSRLNVAFMALVLAAWVMMVTRSRLLLALGSAGALALVGWLAIQPSGPTSHGDLVRGRLYQDAFYFFWRSFGLGVGPAGFTEKMQHNEGPMFTFGAVNPHSGVLEILSQYGLFVSLLVFGLWLAVVVRMAPSIWRQWPDRAETAMRQGLLLMVLTVPLLSFANSTWLKSSVAPAQMIGIALLFQTIMVTSRSPRPTKPRQLLEAFR
ncbi:hypothetical protein M3G03_02615 [Aestuariimicrobium sp. p3-SID1156]|uniref:O-antigen ligase family protein n=1 Tax=Aestuariimicrobium sp. p3-SID1156 TaxID=2916038 RepID=UPI00223AD02A|nr:hypothetical protein [Aestuariimicrobium sp. p3-SID1156]MCT1458444.1 hypothetical protein [Aestuariimicrobium sp. p3-SID1156]